MGALHHGNFTAAGQGAGGGVAGVEQEHVHADGGGRGDPHVAPLTFLPVQKHGQHQKIHLLPAGIVKPCGQRAAPTLFIQDRDGRKPRAGEEAEVHGAAPELFLEHGIQRGKLFRRGASLRIGDEARQQIHSGQRLDKRGHTHRKGAVFEWMRRDAFLAGPQADAEQQGKKRKHEGTDAEAHGKSLSGPAGRCGV